MKKLGTKRHTTHIKTNSLQKNITKTEYNPIRHKIKVGGIMHAMHHLSAWYSKVTNNLRQKYSKSDKINETEGIYFFKHLTKIRENIIVKLRLILAKSLSWKMSIASNSEKYTLQLMQPAGVKAPHLSFPKLMKLCH